MPKLPSMKANKFYIVEFQLWSGALVPVRVEAIDKFEARKIAKRAILGRSKFTRWINETPDWRLFLRKGRSKYGLYFFHLTFYLHTMQLIYKVLTWITGLMSLIMIVFTFIKVLTNPKDLEVVLYSTGYLQFTTYSVWWLAIMCCLVFFMFFWVSFHDSRPRK